MTSRAGRRALPAALALAGTLAVSGCTSVVTGQASPGPVTPTGTGSGGPTYKFAQEIPKGTTYPRGTIAMANTGSPNSTSSQFFLCFTDTQLNPDYTPVGTVDAAGLAVLDKIAAAGNNGSFEAQAGGGAPNLPVTITTMTVVG